MTNTYIKGLIQISTIRQEQARHRRGIKDLKDILSRADERDCCICVTGPLKDAIDDHTAWIITAEMKIESIKSIIRAHA